MKNIINKSYLLLTAYYLLLTILFCAPVWADMADPMRIGVGARSMGMGKAFVGIAQDGDAIFMNPAGMAQSSSLKISSMYSKLLNDVDYTVLGTVYPMAENTSLGFGYIGSRVSDITLTDINGAQQGTAAWGDNVVFVSLGTKAEQWLSMLAGSNLMLGSSLKYYSTGASGDYSSSDSGFNLDLSALAPITNYFNLGINAQNILPTTMSESKDTIPYTYAIGTKLALIGKEDQALFHQKSQTLTLALDAGLTKDGLASHAGIEYWPTGNFALRAGSDAGEFTAGAGMRFAGVEFDYAYHPYYNLPENATHYFSVAYVGDSAPRVVRLTLNSPTDKSVIYEDSVRISGRVEVSGGEDLTEEPVVLKINGREIVVNTDASFSANIPVEKYGKNLLAIKAECGSASDNQQVRLVRLTSFADVPEGFWAKSPIENTSTVGLINGYPDGSFKPNNELTRAELATLLVRSKGIDLTGKTANKVFPDVAANFWAAAYIEEAYKLGIIEGYKTENGIVFRPNNKVKLSEAVAILARFDNLALAPVNEKPYADVSVKHWSAKYVQAAKQAGLLSFIEGDKLGMNKPVTRAAMVQMLSQTNVAGGVIKDLYSWEKGFGPQKYLRPGVKASL